MTIEADRMYSMREIEMLTAAPYKTVAGWRRLGLKTSKYQRVYLQGIWRGGRWFCEGRQLENFLKLTRRDNKETA